MMGDEVLIRRRPNIIVFFTDQQRWDSLGVHGNPLSLTPNLDRAASQGTHFSNTFTCQPVCGPARSCVQTGRYATHTGCFHNGTPLPSDARTLADHFNDAGYTTAYVGKWHLGTSEPVVLEQRGGYQFWLAANALEHTSDSYHTVVYNSQNERVELPGYRVDALTDAAIRFIDSQSVTDRPFFLFLSLLAPHHQNKRDDYPAPDGYRERYMGGWTPPDLASLLGNAHQHLPGYWGMVKKIDEAFGRLLDVLKSKQISDETIVFFTSDHGCHFKTRNGEYKRSCHESSIRVPGVAIGPGFMGGGRVQELVSLIDLPPTLLDCACIPVPKVMQGRSLLPLVHRSHMDWPDDIFVQISESQVGRCVRTKRWKYSVCAQSLDGRMHPGASEYQDEFLYDLYSDPYELTNLVGLSSHQTLVNHLRERLVKRMLQAGEEKPSFLDAPPIPSGQRRVEADEIYE